MLKFNIDLLSIGEIPERFSKEDCNDSIYNDNWKEMCECREIIRKEFGMYALVDLYWTEQLASWMKKNNIKKVLEIQAGKGWLAKALTKHGVEVIATDDFSWKTMKDGIKPFEIIEMDRVEATYTYADQVDAIIVSWPYFDDTAIVDDLAFWPKDKPMIYIGEHYGGCCACYDFFARFEEMDIEDVFELTRWSGIHDRVHIGYWDANKEIEKYDYKSY
jgi:hypothetical protein